jgi:hypothetical protein
MELSGQVSKERRCVPHSSQLRERKDQKLREAGIFVMRNNQH